MQTGIFRPGCIRRRCRKSWIASVKARSSVARWPIGSTASTSSRSSTGQVARFVVFGSFITAKAVPNDVDIVLIMEHTFDLASVTGEAALVFQHMEADAHFWSQRVLDEAIRGAGRGTGYDRILAGTSRRRPTWHRRDCEDLSMIANDQELQTTLDRITWFQNQVAQLRKTEANPVNYRAAVTGFLAEIDRMQLEVREYLRFLPSESAEAAEQNATTAGGRVVGVS
jgi:hypothetical protein